MESCTSPEIPAYVWAVLLFMLAMTAWGLVSFSQWVAQWRIHTNNFGIQFHKGSCYESYCVKEA